MCRLCLFPSPSSSASGSHNICLRNGIGVFRFFLFPFARSTLNMEPRSRSWALGLSIIGLFGLLFSAGFVQHVKADDVQDYGTVIGIVSNLLLLPGTIYSLRTRANRSDEGSWHHILVSRLLSNHSTFSSYGYIGRWRCSGDCSLCAVCWEREANSVQGVLV